MALILKQGKTYKDKFGKEHTDAYGVIKIINNDSHSKQASVILKIFASQDASNTRKEPLETCIKLCDNWTDGETEHNDYDNYMSASAVEADGNHFHRAYLYWIEETKQVDSGGFKREDWESDE